MKDINVESASGTVTGGATLLPAVEGLYTLKLAWRETVSETVSYSFEAMEVPIRNDQRFKDG